jgi:hypothetical protein
MTRFSTAVVYQGLYEARKKAGNRKTRRRATEAD